MPQVRVELAAPLDGRHIVVAAEQVTFGFLEDMQSAQAKLVLDAMAAAIVGGDLPYGCDRAGLRRLSTAQMQPIIRGVMSVIAEPPKSG